MNVVDREADEVWESTLGALRRTRRRRRAGGGIAIAAAVLLGMLVLHPPRPALATRLPESGPPVETSALNTWAVFVWRDGAPSLEAVAPGDLNTTELHFNLEPVLAMTDREIPETPHFQDFGFDPH